jgi:thiamine kinase-like enzyme
MDAGPSEADQTRETQFHDFLKSDGVLDYLQAHPDGPKVLNALRMLVSGLRLIDPRLVHIDYQPGNILWKGERISVVLDREETTLGDPGIEPCRMLDAG